MAQSYPTAKMSGERGRAAATLAAISHMLRTVKQLRTVAGLGLSMYHSLKLTHTGGQSIKAASKQRGAAAWRKPLRCCDMLSEAYARGSVDAVLELQGLFALMLKHNLELPRQYGRKCDILRQG
ncbi:hypothetical protein AB1Y20_011802 [Prymnesium parvum]|uniref:Uncharacterized protein n=1 Tax=Prymnesium parvum TaxID=97485 RepID=A0AB34IL10_PRYPA